MTALPDLKQRAGSVDGHIGAGFIDDADDTQWNPHAGNLKSVGADRGFGDGPDPGLRGPQPPGDRRPWIEWWRLFTVRRSIMASESPMPRAYSRSFRFSAWTVAASASSLSAMLSKTSFFLADGHRAIRMDAAFAAWAISRIMESMFILFPPVRRSPLIGIQSHSQTTVRLSRWMTSS